MTGLRSWFDKLRGRGPKAEEPPPAPAKPTTAPSEGPLPLTEEQPSEQEKADEPDDGPPLDSHSNA